MMKRKIAWLVLLTSLFLIFTGCSDGEAATTAAISVPEQSVSKVHAPSEEYVISCLKSISTITDIAAATEENDPNDKLNEEGGYTAAVFFASSLINQDEVHGDTLIGKGTDAGGCIEVYRTEEDALARNDYLSKFDGGLLDSGSHVVVGTIVVRTAPELTTIQQQELQAEIIRALSDDQIKIEVPTEAPTEATEAPKKEPTSEPSSEAPSETPTLSENSTFSIHYIDVGQADAALVECDGHYLLIDGGNKADSNIIYSVLKQAAVPKLDIVVGTHAHEDHIGGLPGAFNYTTADLTLCPVKSYDSDAFEDFAKYADQKGNGITVPKAGDTYNLGSATVEILGLNAGDEPNDTSIVLRIDYGETSFLFTGDAEREAEQALLNANKNLDATVLKVGHHGSDSSTSYVFLREIMPEYAVISVGEDNSYGHPTEEVLSRLRDADVKTFRTDLQGDITCVSDGKEVSFTVEKNANADTLEPPKPEVVPPATQAPTEAPTEAPVRTTEAEDPEPVGIDYIGNKNTKKFHYASCKSVKQMKESNKYYFTGTRDAMINKGYVPCKNCNP